MNSRKLPYCPAPSSVNNLNNPYSPYSTSYPPNKNQTISSSIPSTLSNEINTINIHSESRGSFSTPQSISMQKLFTKTPYYNTITNTNSSLKKNLTSQQPRSPIKIRDDREEHDRQREEIYKQLPTEQKILSEKKQNQRCEICQQFGKMTHVFHSIIPNPEDFWRILIDNGNNIAEHELTVQFILRTNISISSFVISDDKTKKIEIKNEKERTILKKICDPYAININELKNNIATIEKTIFVKKIIQINIKTIREILEESMKINNINKQRHSVVIIDDDDLIEETEKIKQIETKEIVMFILELFNELSIDSFNSFLINMEEIEDRICKKYHVNSFHQINKEEFTTFCGKNIIFPFNQNYKKKVIPIKLLTREVPIKEEPLSIVINEINKSPYLINLYDNLLLHSIDLEMIISTYNFNSNIFIEINKNNLIKLPNCNSINVETITNKNIKNINIITGIFISHLFDENGPKEGASKYFPILMKSFDLNGISIKTKISRALFVASLLNELPIEFIGLYLLVKTILNIFNLTLNEIISLSLNNICFLKLPILNEIKRCFPNELLTMNTMNIETFPYQINNSIEYNTNRFEFPLPIEIIIDCYTNNTNEEVKIIDFQNTLLLNKLQNEVKNNNIDYLMAFLMYLNQNQKEIIHTFHTLQVTSSSIVQTKNYSSFYTSLKNLKWIYSSLNSFETPFSIINSKPINFLNIPCTPFLISEPLNSYIATKPFPLPENILSCLYQSIKGYDQSYFDFLSVISQLDINLFNEYIKKSIIYSKITNNITQTYINKDQVWFKPNEVFIKDKSGFYPILSVNNKFYDLFKSIGVKYKPSITDYIDALIQLNQLQNQISFNKKLITIKNVLKELIKQSDKINVTLAMIEKIKSLDTFINQNEKLVSSLTGLYYDDLLFIKDYFPSSVKDHLLDLNLPYKLIKNKIFLLLNIKNAQSVIKINFDTSISSSNTLTSILRKVLNKVLPLVKSSQLIENYKLYLSSLVVYSHGTLNPTFTFIPTNSSITPKVTAVRDGINLHVLDRTSICSYEALTILSHLFFLQKDESFITLMLKELSRAYPIQIESSSLSETGHIKTNTINWNVIKDGIKQSNSILNDEEIEIKVEPFQFIPNIEKRIQTGVAGEQFIYQYLKRKFGNKVSWINEKTPSVESIEKGLPYDILLFNDLNTVETYIEVKTTQYNDKDFFELSYREWSFAQEQRSHFHIYRLSGFGTDTLKIKIIVDPYGKWLKGEVHLKFYF
ncbi:hypothetical protein EHI8A_027140 [Entamoeba histolytica HM-1:IMSS-B]|uniref:Protein NO VEIN C-terminal domain-containing protein n=4 Tax=Entamoeba histolytica TaxID=5759 RepID=C4M781_ENTH1|nr:hypothetical protein EHI_199680 [Entamoeba histolytica HM-1:IMSS]EAL49359.1 hypothetical protein EHI_199680 [Entamoeba histolytica HM-1:IMSS]EMH76056.1 hypothetical protein EHI8A_027140 [Entamoeba histolytica HM-1:IMSS-B]EMS13075.1 hypothetical protein KM1_064000 [Entamoeba histolytica HM-3:IMSS]ENY62179.1 hypothetical protein EHI7A_029920 [Entamoeba histolytica HM-1:IMSS-A]|eukprot:XP_654746.1 hypothetical protein EHI_199680 [Entamoeba histolytica HM-1:IMSS]